MAKQLNVDLRFTASGSQAKAQIQDLQSALNNLITTAGKNTTGLGITKDIAQATNEVANYKLCQSLLKILPEVWTQENLIRAQLRVR